eukprot:COSAG02_NODE_217_length_28595_cov_19.642371_30_plen_87_part_00
MARPKFSTVASAGIPGSAAATEVAAFSGILASHEFSGMNDKPDQSISHGPMIRAFWPSGVRSGHDSCENGCAQREWAHQLDTKRGA